jgi:hypothetical protein
MRTAESWCCKMSEVKLHTIEPIVTPDKFEMGVHRMRVPGGWLYWLQGGASTVSSFVPDAEAPSVPDRLRHAPLDAFGELSVNAEGGAETPVE